MFAELLTGGAGIRASTEDICENLELLTLFGQNLQLVVDAKDIPNPWCPKALSANNSIIITSRFPLAFRRTWWVMTTEEKATNRIIRVTDTRGEE